VAPFQHRCTASKITHSLTPFCLGLGCLRNARAASEAINRVAPSASPRRLCVGISFLRLTSHNDVPRAAAAFDGLNMDEHLPIVQVQQFLPLHSTPDSRLSSA
jgi:hypothetical protein